MTTKSIRQQFADTMLDVGREDSNLVVMVGDIGHFSLVPFAEACPGRFYNVGICEPTMISMSAGMAKMGFYPVVHTIAPFIIERSFEQLKLDYCYHGLGGNIVTVGGTFDYSNLGCTHHCYGDFALLKTLPGSQITYPGSAIEFDTLFRQSYQNGALTVTRIPGTPHGKDFQATDIQFGKGIKVTEGRNLTVVATGPQLRSALSAEDALRNMGWDVEIIYIHTVRPMDVDLVRASVEKTRRVLVIEEHMQNGGLGDDVLRATYNIPSLQFSSLSIPDTFLHGYGSYEDHCTRLGLNSEGILKRIREEFIL